MSGPPRQILATSGGFLPGPTGPYAWRRGPIIDHALRLTGKPRPRFCYVGTASGDSLNGSHGVTSAFAGCDDVIVSTLELFTMPNVADPAAHLLSQDVVWVGGGSVANLLAVWRVHGLDDVFREAWERGIVLGGVSAGSICWFVGGTTDSFGPDLRAVTNGLGLLPYANGVHDDSEAQRRPMFQRLIADGTLPAVGHATDDGVGLHYLGTELHDVVSDRAGVSAYLVERDGDAARERKLTARLLAS
jgi:peptidase E